MFAPFLLLLVACGGDKSDTAPPPLDTGSPAVDLGDGDLQTWTGTAHWMWGWDPDPATLACDLVWATSGVATEPCDECVWAFDIDFRYDADASTDRGDCLTTVDETDFRWRLGLIDDLYGYGVPVLTYYDAYYAGWYPLFASSWSDPVLVWGGGKLAYPYTYEGETWYYTVYWTGEAELR